jgi:hypothetical protein
VEVIDVSKEVKLARNQQEAGGNPFQGLAFCTLLAVLAASCFLGLLFNPVDGGNTFLRNVDELLGGHFILHQKIVLCVVAGVRTSH